MMPGMGRMNPRMMKKLQKQLQNSTEEIDATEVIIRTKDKEIYFSNPSVSSMNMMGQQSYQIVGEPQERGLDGEVSTASIPEEDIELVASQAGVSHEKAIEAGAVESLLILSEETRNEQGRKLLSLAEQNRTEIIEISSHHHGGEMLSGLGNVAAILRYRLA